MPYVPLSYEDRKAAQARAIEKSLATRRAKQKDRGPMTYIRISKADVSKINEIAAAWKMSQIDILSGMVNAQWPMPPPPAPTPAPAPAPAPEFASEQDTEQDNAPASVFVMSPSPFD